jgi:HSP20 family protein
MSNLSHWHRAELGKLKNDMDELFDCLVRDFCSPVDLRLLRCEPDLRVVSEKDVVVVTARAPGLDPATIRVTMAGRRLSISGDKVEEFRNGAGMGIARQGFFSSVLLSCPVRADQITARYVGGVLRIVLPKSRRTDAIEVHVDENHHERGSHE